MYTIVVVPVSRSAVLRELSYYSAVEYPVGAVLNVPVRGREQCAVVTSLLQVRASKAALRSAAYTLRKLPRQQPLVVLSAEFVRAAERASEHYACNLGAVLHAYIPKALLAASSPSTQPAVGPRPRLRGFIVPRLYQGLASDRIEFYRATVRESFAVHGSVLLMCPTVADVERVYAALAPGIERYAYQVHGKRSAREQREQIRACLENAHPILLVCTSGYLAIPRHDLTTIIVEREGASAYEARQRPFVDARVLAHQLAEQLGGQLYLADLPSRIDSIYRRETGEYEEVVTGRHRMRFESAGTLISLRGEAREPKKPFYTIGRELLTHTHDTVRAGGRVVLYTARRGLSPVTLCADCSTAVTCMECAASVVLHKGREENYFLCHVCGAMRHARERCVNCHSWRLETFGVGAELVERELQERLPQANVQVLSSDTARTHKAAQAIVDSFYATPSSVLVCTELGLPYLGTQVPLVGVVSLDSLLSIASFAIYERITATVTRLREIAHDTLLVQTRHPDEDVLRYVLAGNFSGFYRSELRARKTMGYPPYTVLIKVSTVGTEQEVGARMDEAVRTLAPHELVVYPRLLRAAGGKFVSHGFLRLPRDGWPDADLVARLRALPPSYTVQVDPDSIL